MPRQRLCKKLILKSQRNLLNSKRHIVLNMFYRDINYNDIAITNHFNGEETIILTQKYTLMLHFDYFLSLNKYDNKLECELKFNLNPVALKLCIDLLVGAKTIKQTVNPNNAVDILHASCTLLCCNDIFYKDLIKHTICMLDLFYEGLLEHKIKKIDGDDGYLINRQSVSRICDELVNSSVYPDVVKTITKRLDYITNTNWAIDEIKDNHLFTNQQCIIFLVRPMDCWRKVEDTIDRYKIDSYVYPTLDEYSEAPLKECYESTDPTDGYGHNKHIKLERVYLVGKRATLNESTHKCELKLWVKKFNHCNKSLLFTIKKVSLSEPSSEFKILSEYAVDQLNQMFRPKPIRVFVSSCRSLPFTITIRDYNPLSVYLVCISTK